MPCLGEAANPQSELATLLAEQKTWLRDALLLHGALLFRGFGISSANRFERILKRADFDLMDYPRS